jgi:hypothetical protein
MYDAFSDFPENMINYENQNYVFGKNKLSRTRIMSRRDLIAYVLCNIGKTTALQAEIFLETKYGDDSVKISSSDCSTKNFFKTCYL